MAEEGLSEGGAKEEERRKSERGVQLGQAECRLPILRYLGDVQR